MAKLSDFTPPFRAEVGGDGGSEGAVLDGRGKVVIWAGRDDLLFVSDVLNSHYQLLQKLEDLVKRYSGKVV